MEIGYFCAVVKKARINESHASAPSAVQLGVPSGLLIIFQARRVGIDAIEENMGTPIMIGIVIFSTICFAFKGHCSVINTFNERNTMSHCLDDSNVSSTSTTSSGPKYSDLPPLRGAMYFSVWHINFFFHPHIPLS